MKKQIVLLNSVSDESRLRILLALREGDLCVTQIVELLELAPSTISKHLSLLEQAGLILGKKEGRWVHYSLDVEGGVPERKKLLFAIFDLVQSSPLALSDRKRLKKIVATKSKEREHPSVQAAISEVKVAFVRKSSKKMPGSLRDLFLKRIHEEP